MKKVVISGINRGLGKALFEIFVAQGYFVYGVLRDKQYAEQLRQNLPTNCQLIVTDLADDVAIEAVQNAVADNPIDLLINNAGNGGQGNTLATTTATEINALFNVHCLGALRLIQALQVNLASADKPLVINLNSRFGSVTRQADGTYLGLHESYAYRIAKAAQNMLTASLRKEFQGEIQFVSLHPGRMKTAMAQVDADLQPEEVAELLFAKYSAGEIVEELGISQLNGELIEW